MTASGSAPLVPPRDAPRMVAVARLLTTLSNEAVKEAETG